MGLLDRMRGLPAPPPVPQPVRDVVHIARTTPFLEVPVTEADDQLEVVGETYRINDIKQLFREMGQPITSSGGELEGVRGVLVPEPWNRHDRNAIAVVVGGHQVGYLAREEAETYGPLLLTLARSGRLLPVRARIWARIDGGMARARVTILVPDPENPPVPSARRMMEPAGKARAIERPARPTLEGRTAQDWVPIIEQLKRDERYPEALRILSWCMSAEISQTRQMGHHHPAPWFFEHAAIVHRKQGNVDLEMEVLESLLTEWPPGAMAGRAGNPDPEKRQRFVDRLDKARELVARKQVPEAPSKTEDPPDGMPRTSAAALIPRGAKVHVTGEEEFHALLWEWLQGRSQWPVVVTLHASDASEPSRIRVKLFGEDVGRLTPGTSSQLAPIVQACAERGRLPVCHAVVKGNELRVDVVLDVAKGSDLPKEWLSSLDAPRRLGSD